MRILLVEDEVRMAEMIKRGLEEYDFEVLVAFDGAMGKKMALSMMPDLIIMDLILPKINGLDLCKEIKATMPELPIIMLTALGTTDDKVEGFDAGANDYLVKMTVNNEIVELVPDKDIDSLFSYTITAVSEHLDIVVTLEKLSGIGSIDANKVKFFTTNNRLTVQSTEATEVSVYTLGGSMKYQRIVNGLEQFDLPAGLYILKAGDNAEKIVVTK